jgi:hypothetical protein
MRKLLAILFLIAACAGSAAGQTVEVPGLGIAVLNDGDTVYLKTLRSPRQRNCRYPLRVKTFSAPGIKAVVVIVIANWSPRLSS